MSQTASRREYSLVKAQNVGVQVAFQPQDSLVF